MNKDLFEVVGFIIAGLRIASMTHPAFLRATTATFEHLNGAFALAFVRRVEGNDKLLLHA